METTYEHNAARFACAACRSEFRHYGELVAHRHSAHRTTTFVDLFTASCAFLARFAGRLDTLAHACRCGPAQPTTSATQSNRTKAAEETANVEKDAPAHAASIMRARADAASPPSSPSDNSYNSSGVRYSRACGSCTALIADARSWRLHTAACSARPRLGIDLDDDSSDNDAFFDAIGIAPADDNARAVSEDDDDGYQQDQDEDDDETSPHDQDRADEDERPSREGGASAADDAERQSGARTRCSPVAAEPATAAPPRNIYDDGRYGAAHATAAVATPSASTPTRDERASDAGDHPRKVHRDNGRRGAAPTHAVPAIPHHDAQHDANKADGKQTRLELTNGGWRGAARARVVPATLLTGPDAATRAPAALVAHAAAARRSIDDGRLVADPATMHNGRETAGRSSANEVGRSR
ncbi:hypothetical protein PybrP1_002585 [[Pythium] brassicae (nom. inval.)]|nr:hypothetical protein PybrP1_002585 [[Pythium] brassicae (nom. inval.)]